MVIKKMGFSQKGEHDFIANVTKAILKKDVSLTHFLLDAKGVMRYESAPKDRSNINFEYDDGGLVKIVCIFSEELIEDLHFKAGNDDLSEPWVRRSVISVIDQGKGIAEVVYNKTDN